MYLVVPYPPSPRPRRATGIPRRRGGEGGGLEKEAISEGWGIYYRGFFPGDLCKIGELFINNSFSVEQATSYFAVTGLPFRRAKTPISCDIFINHPDLTTKMLPGNNKYICFFFSDFSCSHGRMCVSCALRSSQLISLVFTNVKSY